MNKSYQFAMFLLLLTLSGFSQTPQELQVNSVMDYLDKSPEVAEMDQFSSIPVNYHTGRANYNIPLYTIKHHDIKVPLSINYSSDGVQVESTPGIIGEGWVFSGSYYVSRTITGLADDDPNVGVWQTWDTYNLPNVFNDFSALDGEIFTYSEMLNIVDSEYIREDCQLDIFTYNIPGKSGKFFINPYNKDIIQYPEENLKIEMTLVNGDEEIESWKITDVEGRIYEFMATESTGRTVEHQQTVVDDYTRTSVVNWKISKISSQATKAEVKFYYDWVLSQENELSFEENWKKISSGYPSNFSSQTTISSPITQGIKLYLSYIEAGEKRIFFDYESREDYSQSEMPANWKDRFSMKRVSQWLRNNEAIYLDELSTINSAIDGRIFIDWLSEEFATYESYRLQSTYPDNPDLPNETLISSLDDYILYAFFGAAAVLHYINYFPEEFESEVGVDYIQTIRDQTTNSNIISELNSYSAEITQSDSEDLLDCFDQILNDHQTEIEDYVNNQDIRGVRLSQFTVSSKDANNYLTCKFNQSYFTSTGNSNCFVTQKDYQKKRLKLDGIEFAGGLNGNIEKKYDFAYFNPSLLQPRNSTSQDFWGYNNNANNFSDLHPSFSEFGITKVGAKRNPAGPEDFNYAVSGLLEEVTLPTGGKINFEYEPHDYAYVGDITLEGYTEHLNYNSTVLAGRRLIYQARVNAGTYSIQESDESTEFTLDDAATMEFSYDMGTSDDITFATILEDDGNGNFSSTGFTLSCSDPGGDCGSGTSMVHLAAGTYKLYISILTDTILADDYTLANDVYFGTSILDPATIEEDGITALAGGMRVKKITMHPTSGESYNRSFKYIIPDESGILLNGGTSGVLNYDIPKYWNKRIIEEAGTPSGGTADEVEYLVFSSKNFTDYALPRGSHIGYSDVVEILTGTDDNLIGNNHYSYTTARDYPMTLAVGSPTGLVEKDDGWKRGLLESVITRDANDDIVKESHFTNVIDGNHGYIPMIDLKWEFRYSQDLLDDTRNSIDIMKKLWNTGRTYVSDKIEKIDGIETSTSFKYSNSNFLPEEIEVEDINEVGDRRTLIYYPMDFWNSSTGTSGHAGIDQLIDAHMIGLPVMTLELIVKDPAQLYLLSATYNDYSSTTEQQGFVSSVKQYRPASPELKTSPELSSLVFGNLSAFETISTRSTDNQFNRINEIINEDGIPISIIWDHEFNYPTIICKGLTYNELKSEIQTLGYLSAGSTFELDLDSDALVIDNGIELGLVTVLRWNKPRGIITHRYSSENNANSYSYDMFNSLKTVSNHDLELLIQHEYNYVNK